MISSKNNEWEDTDNVKITAEAFDYNFCTMVCENKWLFEDFVSIACDTAMNLNGDGKIKIDNDRYGLVTAYNPPDALTASTWEKNIDKAQADLEATVAAFEANAQWVKTVWFRPICEKIEKNFASWQ